MSLESAVQTDVSVESLVAQVADEFLDRQRRGEKPTAEEYAAKHPEAADLLRKVLASLEVIGLSAAASQPGAPLPVDHSSDALMGTLGDYRLLGEIGRGGMGVVYEAQQISLRRRVALKVLPFAATMDKRQLQRFINESQAAASLEHPHIVPVYGVGCERGVHYYAMRFIEGQSLEALLQTLRQDQQPAPQRESDATVLQPRAVKTAAARSGETVWDWHGQGSTLKSSKQRRDNWHRVAELALQAAEALEHAHQSGVVHRDIKPANLLLDDDGNLWITDFGLAQIQSDTRLTMTGDLVGTLRYMSPEQALAKRVIVDHRTDIYSLGATFYEVLTLKPVFGGQDRQELLRQIAFEEPVPPRRLNRGIPVELETVLLKALEKNPADRYGTAKEAAEDLKRFLNDEPTLARRPTLLHRGRKWGRRHKAAVRAGAVVLAALAMVLGTVLLWRRDWTMREAETARAVIATLQEADGFQRERKIPEALAVARRAEATLAGGTGTPALEQRVEARLSDLRFVLDLEDIRLVRATDWKFDKLDYAQADRNYAQAFRSFGIDMNSLPPDEAAMRVRERSVAIELAAALDDWSMVIRQGKLGDGARWKGLLQVARAADPDPFRSELRKALEQGDNEALKTMLTKGRGEELSPPTLVALAMALEASGRYEEEVQLLRQAQRRHAGDYWINFRLAYALGLLPVPEHDEAIRYYTATLALRPESAPAYTNLGIVFRKKERLDEAVAMLREALRLKPDLLPAHFHLGDALHENGQIDEAVAAYRQLLLLKPDVAAAHTNLGMALEKKGRLDDAIAAHREAIRLQPDLAAAHLNLGGALQSKGLVDEAIAASKEALRLEPDSAEGHVNLGNALVSKEQIDEAIILFQDAIRLKPGLVQAHSSLGRALGQKGQLDDSIAALKEAVRLKPNAATYHYSLGVSLLLNNQIDEAIAANREAIRLKPDDVEAHTNLGIALGRKGLTDQAIAAYQEALRHQPGFAKAHYNLAVALKNKGLYDEAITAYQEAVKSQPDYVLAHAALGNALLDKGRTDDAIAAYRDAISHEPTHAEAHYGLGRAFQGKKQLDDALAAYREAIRLKPNYPQAHNNVGLVFRDMEQLDNAIAAFREAVRLKPDLFQAHINLADMLQRRGKVSEAIDALREGIRHKPDLAQAHHQLGYLLERQGKMDEAIDAYQAAIKLKPSDVIVTRLGHVFEAKGQFADAIDCYQKAVRLNAAYYPAHSDLAWLLGTAAEVSLRDPKQALASAKKAIELAPKIGHPWKALGVGHYRRGEWQAAIDALGQSMKLQTGGDSSHFFFLAMAHWQLGDKDQARTWFDKGAKWMERLPTPVAELQRFRAEAAELLGINEPEMKDKKLSLPKK